MSTSASASASAFHYFPALPPELRFLIWEAALSAPSVWAAVRVPRPASNRKKSVFNMAFVGTAPPTVALSCKEAWRLLKQSYPERIHGPGGSTAKTRPYWVNLHHTVVYLGSPVDAVAILASFDADALSKFQHVALVWNTNIAHFGAVARACQRLATTCPALCTIIVEFYRRVSARDSVKPLEKPLTPESAAYYAGIPAYTGPQLDGQLRHPRYFRDQLLRLFGASPPRLHFLAPDAVQGLP
ncbi:hypothetical protein F5144DRAFT_271469 [Chaetomium tenue]|uniref:Uncharacterized protein n=1 Tax=Chaetomium tenue TaxID=1854479 RepID=A0ACB7P078_9PEZI|nr:hypothetical protein F5144DRAFT_271469 [Chaetomium globosum]